jgi:ketosteroid isomerase-like protein
MTDQSAEEQAIRGQIGDWVAAVQRRDAHGIAEFYTRDGRFLCPNAPIAAGREAVAAMWGKLLGLANVALSFGPDVIEVAGSGELAYDLGRYSLAFDGPGGRVEDIGKYVVVWKKEGGVCKAAADILNSDKPAAKG